MHTRQPMMKKKSLHILSLVFVLVLSCTLLSAQTLRKVNIPVGKDATQLQIQQLTTDRFPVIATTGSELQLIHAIESPGGRHYTFRQTWQGLPIYGAGVKVNLVPGDRITSFLATLQPFENTQPGVFSYSEENLLQRVAEEGAFDAKIEPMYWVKNNRLLPVYQVVTFSNGPISSEEILIDAVNGQELQRQDLGTYFQGDTTGRGRVFRPNPCTRGSVHYGDSFVDNNDTHSSLLEGLMDTVVLREITWDDPVFRLTGPYVRISDRAPFFMTPATSPDGDFFYGRDQSEFEDVMVYYHIDTFQRFVQSLGFTNLQNGALEVDPHGKSDSDQSVFISNGGNSYILFGDGGVDDAEDADVIIHEYTHALSYSASLESNSGTERRGLDEGLGDYFAAVYSLGLNPGFGWSEIFNWDGHNEFWAGRTVVTTQTYPPTSNSIYTYGELWASTLIQIRNEIGGAVTDRLTLQEMYSNYSQMSLSDAAYLFLQADTALYGGIHSEMIIFHFCQRGILSGATCLSVGLEEIVESGQISLYPNPGRGDFTLKWQQSSPGGRGRLEIENMLGQKVFIRTGILPGEVFFSTNLPSGLYQIKLWEEETAIFRKKWVIE
ncbi:MAG: T9SS type A sorting domain-containing protein [Bacteroidia bacterium]|nr:T9SS type A sorting domain-containing protein [Bacteroidia bacterium]